MKQILIILFLSPRLYARLRGLSELEVNKVTEWGLKKLGLLAYSDR